MKRVGSHEMIPEMETIAEVEEEETSVSNNNSGSDDDSEWSWYSTSGSEAGSRDQSPARSSREPSPVRSASSSREASPLRSGVASDGEAAPDKPRERKRWV